MRIKEFERRSPNHYRLNTSSSDDRDQQIDLHIIDPVRKIAAIFFRSDTEWIAMYAARERIGQLNRVNLDFTKPPQGAIEWDEADYKLWIDKPKDNSFAQECGRSADSKKTKHHEEK